MLIWRNIEATVMAKHVAESVSIWRKSVHRTYERMDSKQVIKQDIIVYNSKQAISPAGPGTSSCGGEYDIYTMHKI